MLSFVKGKLANISSNLALVDIGPVGLEVFIPAKYIPKLKINQNVLFYTYLHIKETGAQIYGFLEYEELELFKKIISVKSIGPKSALSILSFANTDSIQQAIENNNVTFFSSVPGIGPKAAKRIILELKDKLIKDDQQSQDNDIIEALAGLGLSKTKAKQVLSELYKHSEFHKLSIEEKIKQALKFISKND